MCKMCKIKDFQTYVEEYFKGDTKLRDLNDLIKDVVNSYSSDSLKELKIFYDIPTVSPSKIYLGDKFIGWILNNIVVPKNRRMIYINFLNFIIFVICLGGVLFLLGKIGKRKNRIMNK